MSAQVITISNARKSLLARYEAAVAQVESAAAALSTRQAAYRQAQADCDNAWVAWAEACREANEAEAALYGHKGATLQ